MRAKHNKRPFRSSPAPHLALFAVLMAQAYPALPALPEPAQTPMLNRPESKPRPNVMFTLDDSGSMTYQYLPERDFLVNTKTVSFPNDGKVFLHPRELPTNKFSFDNSYTDSFYVTAAPLSDLTEDSKKLQMQMRSPDVNGLYYSPSRRYLPWKTADGTPFLDAEPSHVWLNPMYYRRGTTVPADKQNDYVDLKSNSSASVKWYCSNDIGYPNYNLTACSLTTLTYRPALVYLLKITNTSDPTLSSSYDEYDINASDTVSYPGRLSDREGDGGCSYNESTKKTDCSKSVELQNYANWFAFHRSRLFVASSAIPDSLRSVKNSIRLGWGTIHPKLTVTDGRETWSQFKADSDIGSQANSGSVQQGVRPLSDAHLSTFTDWIRTIGTVRRTPTLHAMSSVGDYFRREALTSGGAIDDAFSPWQNELTDPSKGGTRPAPLSCRRSYHIVVTDGYYNTNDELNALSDNIFQFASIPFTSVGNADTTDTASAAMPGSRNTAQQLLTTKVFQDGLSDTLADYAMDMWFSDLQKNLPNTVTPIPQKTSSNSTPTTADLINEVKGDPATWQHLTHFMVGFGVTGTLNERDATTLADLINGTQSWPASLSRIDDLWHAAINSRGKYFPAKDSKSLQESISEALRLSSTALLKESGLATLSSQIVTTVETYVPEYNPVSWTGDVQAKTVDTQGNYSKIPRWSANLQIAAGIARGLHRNLYINDAGTISAFSSATYDALSSATKNAVSNNLARYLSGSLTDIDGLRPRAVRSQIYPDGTSNLTRQYLSDIVNSNPLLSTTGIDLGYNNANQDASYTIYRNERKKRTENLLLIGANDGMLHAFKASTGDEVFGFIPAGAIPNLRKIAQIDYGYADSNNTHRFLVDGPLVESDVQLGTLRTWTDVVVGTMGAGGRSIFALKLDASNPESMNASSVLWETQGTDGTSNTDSHANIGYITAPPQIGRLPDGKWKVFVGNGVDSASGNAALLMLDMDDGSITPIVAYQRTATGTNATANGLGGVALIQDPNTNNVIGAYAGDIQGNVWRFDVTSTATASNDGITTYSDSRVVVAQDSHSANAPLFTATVPESSPTKVQAIVANPVVISHRMGGQLVIINTGKLLTTDDGNDTSIQSAYGLWDKTSFGGNQLTAMQTITRSQLQPQTIDRSELTGYLEVTANTIDWGAMWGWRMDLDIPSGNAQIANARPKALFAPQKFGGSVLISASTPSSSTESCTATTSLTYNFFVKALTGSRALLASVDTNHDGVIDVHDDLNVAGWISNGERPNILCSGDSCHPPTPCKLGNAIDPVTGQLIKDCGVVKERVWRQLLNPPHP